MAAFLCHAPRRVSAFFLRHPLLILPVLFFLMPAAVLAGVTLITLLTVCPLCLMGIL